MSESAADLMGEQPCDAYDGCEVAAALVLDVYALGQSMQIRVCVDHYRALASTKAEFWDRRPGFGVYTVPDDPLCVVLVGDLRGESSE